MAENTEIRRSHEWVMPKRDDRRQPIRCRICGAVKRPGIASECYSERADDGEPS